MDYGLISGAGKHGEPAGTAVEYLEHRRLLNGVVAPAATIGDVVPGQVLIYSPNSEVKAGQSVEADVIVTTDYWRPVATGLVRFSDENGTPLGQTALSNGRGSLQLSSLRRGYHQISATYLGDETYTSRQSIQPLPVHVGASNVVDVMIVYTDQAAASISGVANNITDLAYQAVADANDALLNSRIDLSLELVAVERVNYTESGVFNTDLTRLQAPKDGYLDDVMALRDIYGADLVSLFVGSGDSGGLGYVLSDLKSSTNANWGFTEVYAPQAAAPGYTLAHELGHNFGAVHDHQHDDGTKGLFSDSYGYRFTANGTEYHDVMAYDPGTTIPYYSNPDVSYQGVATGVAGYANAARAISTSASTVAGYRQTKVPLVTPTQTTLSAPKWVDMNSDVTITANVAGQLANPHLPAGRVVLLDEQYELGTAQLINGVATWTGRLPLELETHNLRALYINDDYFGDSLSATLTSFAYGSTLRSDGTLRIIGPDSADTISLIPTGQGYAATLNGAVSNFNSTGVARVRIDGNGGNDNIAVSSSVALDCQINGEDGRDTLSGGSGNDSIVGGRGYDLIYGNAGNDILRGEAADDTLRGGSGNDALEGGAGADQLVGATGDDTLYAMDGWSDTLTAGDGNDLTLADDGLETPVDVAEVQLTLSAAGGLNILGTAGNDSINLTATTAIFSFSENGRLLDYPLAGINAINIAAFAGDDVVRIGSGVMGVNVGGGKGNDLLVGGDGRDVIRGALGNDTIIGNRGPDEIHGGAGNDSIDGGGGADTLYGGEGVDTIAGGQGDNWIYSRDGLIDQVSAGTGTTHLQRDRDDVLNIAGTLVLLV